MADPIMRLPPTQISPSAVDMRIMQSLFGNSVVGYELKRLILPALAFFILSLYPVDELLHKLIPTTGMVFLLVKTTIFVLIIIVGQIMGLA